VVRDESGYRGECGEARRGRRRDAACRSGAATLEPLVRGEEPNLVLPTDEHRLAVRGEVRVRQWAAEVRAAAEVVRARHEEVAGGAVARDARILLQSVEGVQEAVAEEAVERAVVVVRAALCDGDELPAVGAPVLGGELVLDERELGDLFRRDVALRAGHSLVIVVNAVEHEVVVAGALAADRAAGAYAYAARTRNVRRDEGKVVNARCADAGLRQLDHLTVVEGLRERGGGRVNQLRAASGDFDRLAREADGQLRRDV